MITLFVLNYQWFQYVQSCFNNDTLWNVKKNNLVQCQVFSLGFQDTFELKVAGFRSLINDTFSTESFIVGKRQRQTSVKLKIETGLSEFLGWCNGSTLHYIRNINYNLNNIFPKLDMIDIL